LCHNNNAYGGESKFQFYSEKICISYADQFVLPEYERINKENIYVAYNHLQSINTDSLIETLQNLKVKYQLDDWLFYSLIKKFTLSIDRRTEYNDLYNWFLLARCDYDVRLIYNEKGRKQVRLIITGDVGNTDSFFMGWTLDDKLYLDINTSLKKGLRHYIDLDLKGGSKPMKFQPVQAPNLPNREIVWEDRVLYFGKNDSLNVKLPFDLTKIQILHDYPLVDYGDYYEIPINEELIEIIDTILYSRFENKSEKQKLEIIYNFTIQMFSYCDDEDLFLRREVPQSLEQAFYYNKGDCEDYTLFIFMLADRYTNFDLIAIKYMNHVTFGVGGLETRCDESFCFEHNDKKYLVIEPDLFDYGRLKKTYWTKLLEVTFDESDMMFPVEVIKSNI